MNKSLYMILAHLISNRGHFNQLFGRQHPYFVIFLEKKKENDPVKYNPSNLSPNISPEVRKSLLFQQFWLALQHYHPAKAPRQEFSRPTCPTAQSCRTWSRSHQFVSNQAPSRLTSPLWSEWRRLRIPIRNLGGDPRRSFEKRWWERGIWGQVWDRIGRGERGGFCLWRRPPLDERRRGSVSWWRRRHETATNLGNGEVSGVGFSDFSPGFSLWGLLCKKGYFSHLF